MKKIDYRIINEGSIADLEGRVNQMLEVGWEPLGGATLQEGEWIQTLTRPVKSPAEKTSTMQRTPERHNE